MEGDAQVILGVHDWKPPVHLKDDGRIKLWKLLWTLHELYYHEKEAKEEQRIYAACIDSPLFI